MLNGHKHHGLGSLSWGHVTDDRLDDLLRHQLDYVAIHIGERGALDILGSRGLWSHSLCRTIEDWLLWPIDHLGDLGWRTHRCLDNWASGGRGQVRLLGGEGLLDGDGVVLDVGLFVFSLHWNVLALGDKFYH